MRKFPCVFMRGGTSKGCMFLESDLPARDQWDDIFVQAMGSPDPKQIDGLGGCVSSNNKIVVVRKSDRPGIDVDYIVGQSIVGQSKIDYKSNCGNMTAATAPYAVEMGLVTEAVAIDTAVLFELLRKLLGHLLMMVGVDVTQGVLDGERLIGLGQVGFAAGCATVALFELRVLRKLVVQLDRHRIVCKIDHGGFLTFIKIFL